MTTDDCLDAMAKLQLDPFLREAKGEEPTSMGVPGKSVTVSDRHILCPNCRTMVRTYGKLTGNIRCQSCRCLLSVRMEPRAYFVTEVLPERQG